jgi:hypothetical protein
MEKEENMVIDAMSSDTISKRSSNMHVFEESGASVLYNAVPGPSAENSIEDVGHIRVSITHPNVITLREISSET